MRETRYSRDTQARVNLPLLTPLNPPGNLLEIRERKWGFVETSGTPWNFVERPVEYTTKCARLNPLSTCVPVGPPQVPLRVRARENPI